MTVIVKRLSSSVGLSTEDYIMCGNLMGFSEN
jgi:hypothetical protein